MKTVNDYMKPLQDAAARTAKRRTDLTKDIEVLTAQKAALEAELDEAFAADDTGRYDALFAKRDKLAEQIASRQSYLDRIGPAFTDADVAEAWNAYLAEVANRSLSKKIDSYNELRTKLAKLLLEIAEERQRVVVERSTMGALMTDYGTDLVWPVAPPFTDFRTINCFLNGAWSEAEQSQFANIAMHGGAAV